MSEDDELCKECGNRLYDQIEEVSGYCEQCIYDIIGEHEKQKLNQNE